MFRKPVRFVLALALLALVVACGKKEEQQAADAVAQTDTPQGSIDAAVASLKAGDLKALIASQVPPSHMEKLRTEWKEDMAKDPPSEEEKAEFAKTMAELTADDAEDQLMAKLEPELVKFETEMAPQMPMMVGMGRGLVINGIQESKELNDSQKAEAIKSIDALANWVQTTKFTDRDLVKQAVTHVITAARELNIKTLDEARALSFDDAMAKGSIAFRGVKNLLETYGFSMDKVLDTVKSEVVSQSGNDAKVRVSYKLFDTPLSFETELVQVDGRWYGKKTIEELNKPKDADDAEAPAEADAG